MPAPDTTAAGLLSDVEAAAYLGIGTSTFHGLRDKPWMPKPKQLGPRLLRWSRAELEAAIGNMPVQQQRGEPAQLARARIDRMKGRP